MTFRSLQDLARLALLVLTLLVARTAVAGGGPENVFLVVNSASWASLSVANQFIQLRQIPPINVLSLPWVDGFEVTDGESLRTKILAPVLQTIERRGLRGQIDYIVYSSDFPYAVDLGNDFAGAGLTDQARPVCSLNSATYLMHLVVGRKPAAMNPDVNRYMRLATKQRPRGPTHAFRSWYGWTENGTLNEAGGQPYMLSTVLAVTSGRGNSLNEVTNYLRSAAAADGTAPTHSIYYSRTEDIRSKVRAPGFTDAIDELKTLGVKGEIISVPLPTGKDDVAGLSTGVASYSWARARSKILPGAICENFTSFGGMLSETAPEKAESKQTPLTEFLRYGAAGSSGTVIEPYALWPKFPSPLLHYHYAQGCTLAEAYYQSVYAPAQLLIVGDPLCRPWANIPQVEVTGIKSGTRVSGKIEITPSAKLAKGGKVDRYELFINGHRTGAVAEGDSFIWDSANESDGYHELRVVAIEQSPIETQGRAIIHVMTDNHGQKLQVTASPSGKVRWDEKLRLQVQGPADAETFVVYNDRAVGRAPAGQSTVEVDPRLLGLGPVTLHVLSVSGTQASQRMVSAPLRFTVEPAKPLPALSSAPASLRHGLLLKLASGETVPVQGTLNENWLSGDGVDPNQPYTLAGFFEVPADDVYQFQVWHFGELKLGVDSSALYSNAKGDFKENWIPVSLAAGKHRLTVSGRPTEDTRLRILFGGQGTWSLKGDTFKHPR